MPLCIFATRQVWLCSCLCQSSKRSVPLGTHGRNRAITEQRIRRIPDLIILDIGMPKMDGYAFARLLKSKPQFNHTVIIMLTSRDGVIDRLKGRLAGAKDYITKPFRTQELMDRLHLYLGLPTYT